MSEDFRIEEKGNHQQRKKRRKGTLADMILCPYCKAMSYPRVYREPQDEVQKEAIICGSCGADLRPYVKAMEAYERKMQEQYKLKDKGDIVLENDEGEKEYYPDAEKIVKEALTETQR
jgi:hypothetical protein